MAECKGMSDPATMLPTVLKQILKDHEHGSEYYGVLRNYALDDVTFDVVTFRYFTYLGCRKCKIAFMLLEYRQSGNRLYDCIETSHG